MKTFLILLTFIFGALSAQAESTTYVIKKGDQLMLVSKKIYGTYHKWQEIVKANPTIHPNFLKIGQKISIPEITPAAAPVEVSVKPMTSEFTEESVISLLEFNQTPDPSSFIDEVKDFFNRKPASESDSTEGIHLDDNGHEEKNESKDFGFKKWRNRYDSNV